MNDSDPLLPRKGYPVDYYKFLFLQNPIPMWIYDRESLKIFHVNEAALKFYGYSESEFLSLTIKDLRPKEEYSKLEKYLHQIRNSGKSGSSGIWTHQKKDGSLVQVEIFSHPFHSHDLNCRVVYATDMTTSLRVFSATGDCVFLLTPKGKIEWINPEASESFAASSMEDIVDRFWPNIWKESCREHLAEGLERAGSGQHVNLNAERINHHGERRIYNINLTSMPGLHGNPDKLLVVARDQTEAQKAAEDVSLLAHRYENLLDNLTEGFLSIDRQWKIQYINPRGSEIVGLDRTDILDRVFFDVFPDVKNTAFENLYNQVLESGISDSVEAFYPPLNSWFEVLAYPTNEGFAVIFKDISKNRLYEDQLKTSKERFKLAARAANDVVWDWNLQTDQIWWSEGMKEHFGYDISEEETPSSFWSDLIYPEQRNEVLKSVSTATNDPDMDYWQQEYFLKKHDGTWCNVLDKGYIMRNSNGEATRIVGQINDVSADRKAARKLQEQARLLDEATDAIVLCDLHWKITFWNRGAQKVFNINRKDVLDESLLNAINIDHDLLNQIRDELLRQGSFSTEIKIQNQPHHAIFFESSWTLLCDEDKNPESMLAILTDVTERKKLENQFLRVQRMESLGTLAGGIAHDLNNVLAPIRMSIELLRMKIEDPQIRQTLDTIDISAKRGADMVRQVLSFARGMEGQKIIVNPHHVVEDLHNILKETFPKSIQFRVSNPKSLNAVEADPTQLHQLLLNICVNARDAMKEGGTLIIDVSNVHLDESAARMQNEVTPGHYIVFEISDTGTGIPNDIQNKIFDPFYTTKMEGEGTGLGLSTALAIIRSHNGFINLYSELNSGTTFKIYLPALENHEDAVSTSSINAPRGKGETILVVDDENAVQQIARSTLEAFGYNILTAGDGAEALSIFAKQNEDIDLVIVDMMMPIMDGPATISAIFHIQKDAKIIASSGLQTNDRVAKAFNAGVQHFLNKPYSAQHMLQTIREALDDSSPPSG